MLVYWRFPGIVSGRKVEVRIVTAGYYNEEDGTVTMIGDEDGSKANLNKMVFAILVSGQSWLHGGHRGRVGSGGRLFKSSAICLVSFWGFWSVVSHVWVSWLSLNISYSKEKDWVQHKTRQALFRSSWLRVGKGAGSGGCRVEGYFKAVWLLSMSSDVIIQECPALGLLILLMIIVC